ncbi:MAG: hypothetical protein RI967_219 [Planctomycetota bacterium]
MEPPRAEIRRDESTAACATRVAAPGTPEATPDRVVRPAPLAAADIPAFDGRPQHGLFALAHIVHPEETSALVPHANNVAILGWIDELASLHGAHAGAARETLAARGAMWFVASHEIRYLGESFAGDELVLACWCPSVGRTSLVRESRVLARADGRILVAATSRWAHVDLATRRPSPMPPEVRAALVAG